jgi:hypothetical protein
MKLLLFFLSLAACVTNICTAQKIIITGSVKDTNNIKIIGATITLHTKQNNTVIAYSYTNSTGNYEIVFPEKFLHQSCIIKATALNFDIAIKDLDYSNNNFFYNFILKPSFKNLSEVIVQSKLPISIKKDTLNYNVENFINKFDRSIGDVLQKLPGIEIMPNGIIKYQGKAINKFYIDGKDMLDGRYNIATNNISSDVVDKVQVLENHQPIKVLDSFSSSNKAAINLVLKDKARNKIIGKAKLGIGFPFMSTDNEIVPLFFSKNYQSIATLKYNNVGKDYAKEQMDLYEDLDNPLIYTNTTYGEMINISKPTFLGIDVEKFISNQQFSATLNQLKTTKNNNDFKLYIDFTNDNLVINNSNLITQFFINDTIRITEKNYFQQRENLLKGSLQYSSNKPLYNFTNDLYFKFQQKNISLITSNNNPNDILQNAKYTYYTIANKVNSFFRQGKHVFNLSLLIGAEQQPQQLIVSNGMYDTIFTIITNPSFVVQDIALKTYYTSFNSSWNYKINSKISFSNTLNVSFIKNILNTSIHAGMQDSLYKMKNGFSNNLIPLQTSIQNTININYKISKLFFSINIPITYNRIYFNSPHNNNFNTFDNLFGIASTATYNIHKRWKFSVTVANQIFIGSSLMKSNGYILSTYRNLKNNNSIIPIANNFSIESSLNYRDIIKSTFLSISFSHYKNTRSPISNNQFIHLISLNSAINGNTRGTNNSIAFSFSKYVSKIKTSFTLQSFLSNFLSDNYFNGINSKFFNNSFQLGLKTNSTIKEFSIVTNTKWNVFTNKAEFGKASKFSILEQQLAFKASFNANIFVTINSNYNLISQKNIKPTHFLYPDFFLTYTINKLKTDIELGAQNLFNQKTFSQVTFYGNTESRSTVELRPFQILLKATLYLK